ncbi:PREDICTED: decapping and exoribonuclease protein-like [Papilio xuthus]|uniref:Decapping nuclease n=1 Tax=Papilio xuthus TaxID=66420 RepID=A0AAJ6Z6Y5_PAPXU|nr:PREDICTED: decapping and exoribonuclease protein-like [Papilio xuthus]
MHHKLPTNTTLYGKSFPSFEEPKIIGYIGYENLMFAKSVENKQVNLDLNYLREKTVLKPQNLDVKLDELLKFLLQNEIRLNLCKNYVIDNAKFMCYRGLMTCIACTPYEKKEGWRLVAILFKGNIYLCKRDTEEKRIQKQNFTKEDQKFTSWGYKFEQYILSESPHAEPNPNLPLDENKEFSLVFKTHLKKHTLIYGAEMDGIRCDKTSVESPPDINDDKDVIINYLSKNKFIELKTNRHIEFSRQKRNFRLFKTIKWWCQSMFAGVNTILCGFRNDDGVVEELKVYEVNGLPKISRGFWNPNVCFDFLETFLTYVKECLTTEIRNKYGERALNKIHALPLISLHFEWYPGSPVRVTDNYVHEDDPILPTWFTENFMAFRCDE